MDVTLMLPACGSSSRYPGVRPKWLLTHPRSGEPMIVASACNLDVRGVGRIVAVVLREHIDKYISDDELRRRLGAICDDVKVCVIGGRTEDTVETLCAGIEMAGVSGPFVTKDVDNEFSAEVSEGNFVAAVSFGDPLKIHTHNKATMEVEAGTVVRIEEKRVIGEVFACGMYGFGSARQFVDKAREVRERGTPLYVSQVVGAMIRGGENFSARMASEYSDWGTLGDWLCYVREHRTVFCDLDGVLVENTSRWLREEKPRAEIASNVARIRELASGGKCQIVITTARPECARGEVVRELREYGIPFDQLVMGLWHCRRQIVNDYSATNPYPSCEAINIPRGSDELARVI